MPLSEHEQRILEQYEKELQQDPHLTKRISRSSLYTRLSRRVRLAVVGFVVGLVMVMLFWVSLWVAVIGFTLMLLSSLIISHYIKRIGRDQLVARGGKLPMAGIIARIAERFRGRPDKKS
jgi:ABC-type multidrug transport system fused ATPase/permease subunit